ncbi:MAG: hypothetical protein ACO4BZ_09055 [Ilumatobacteraceae bacterium]
MWGSDSFEQGGVELGKVLASRITPQLVSDEPIPADTDPTTSAAIAWYRRHRSR